MRSLLALSALTSLSLLSGCTGSPYAPAEKAASGLHDGLVLVAPAKGTVIMRNAANKVALLKKPSYTERGTTLETPAAAAASFSLFNGISGTVQENSGFRFLTLLGEPEGHSNPYRIETGDGNYERGYSIIEMELQRGGVDLETGWLSARSICLVRTEVGLVKYVAGTVEMRLSRNEAGEPVLTVTCPRGSAEVSYVNFTKDAAYTKAVVRGGYIQITQNQAAGRTTVVSGDTVPAKAVPAKEAPAAQ
jgi:hypothetical protein